MVINKPLQIKINMTYKEGILPKVWKKAKITIYKIVLAPTTDGPV